MSQEIKTSQTAAAEARQKLLSGLDSFCTVRLVSLSGAIPVEGSAIHDGSLTQALLGALDAYNVMIQNDASMVQGIQDSLAAADAAAANSLA